MNRQDNRIVRRRWLLASVLLASMITGAATTAAADAASTGPPRASGDPSSFVDAPIRFFQEIISPVDGPRCHSYPTCSTYARQSVAAHGAFMGWIMTCDRLMRDGRDDNHLLPRIRVGSHDYADDPVSANDFWWYRKP